LYASLIVTTVTNLFREFNKGGHILEVVRKIKKTPAPTPTPKRQKTGKVKTPPHPHPHQKPKNLQN